MTSNAVNAIYPVVDVHCHALAVHPNRGGYMNPKFFSGVRTRYTAYSLKLSSAREALSRNLPGIETYHDLYENRLVTQVEGSKKVDRVVVMPFDGVYDRDGFWDKDRTVKRTTNEYVVDLTKRSKKFVLSMSVNPFRRDWRDQMDMMLEAGAVHNKLLPSVMDVKLDDPKLAPYYKYVVDKKLPHLVHFGHENALPNIDISLNETKYLLRMLEQGVTVIAAHVCGGKLFREDWAEIKMLGDMVDKYQNLYFDISGMISPHRRPRLVNALKDERIRSRIVFGTDYPVPLWPRAFRRELGNSAGIKASMLSENYFDQYAEVVSILGCTDEMMRRAGKVLNIV